MGFDLFLTCSLIIAYVSARPHSNFHSRFTQPNYNFGFNFSPYDFPSNHIDFTYPIPGFGRALEPPEAMWPLGVFLPPEFDNVRGHYSPDFSNGADYPDPYLLTGHAARRAVAYLFRKELFFGDYPHAAAVARNNDERRQNGLQGHLLSSSRHNSPFYRY